MYQFYVILNFAVSWWLMLIQYHFQLWWWTLCLITLPDTLKSWRTSAYEAILSVTSSQDRTQSIRWEYPRYWLTHSNVMNASNAVNNRSYRENSCFNHCCLAEAWDMKNKPSYVFIALAFKSIQLSRSSSSGIARATNLSYSILSLPSTYMLFSTSI